MCTAMQKPELLSPAGSLEKLKVAVDFGADAVYLAGQKYGLRTAAENFSFEELEEGLDYAHSRGARAFIVLNSFFHDRDLSTLAPFLHFLESIKIDAAIVSDLGVMKVIQKESHIPIHLSTQASCLNVRGGRLWRDQGVSRLILGRETSIRDAGLIKRETGLEVELFIHGSMCMAYSGNCTISNYTQGRDSNRGGCAQSCRFSYELKSLDSQKTVSNSFFMSSKDLMGVSEIPLFVEEKIDSLKIEGRMRSPLYAATVTKIYRESLDRFFNEGQLSPEFLDGVGRELELVPHRDYTDASLVDPAGENSVYTGGGRDKKKEQLYLGVVRQVIDERYFLVETKLGFSEGETLELLRPTGDAFAFKAISLQDCVGEERAKINPNVLVRIPYVKGVSVGQILRKVGFV